MSQNLDFGVRVVQEEDNNGRGQHHVSGNVVSTKMATKMATRRRRRRKRRRRKRITMIVIEALILHR